MFQNSVAYEGQEEKAIAIALNLLKQGISIDVISQATGLSISELEGFANAQLQKLQTEP